MRNRIKRAVMTGFLIAASVCAGACLLPPGEACGDEWCSEGYRCVSVDTTVTCLKSTCGNGIVDANEECDDGNLDNNDGCLWICKLNTCGDGEVNPRTEECDDSNGENGDGCDSNCTVTACGNGIVTVGESCDDGDKVDNDGCDNDCAVGLLVYVKASNTDALDEFGFNVAVSADGSTLAVGAPGEASTATDIDGKQDDNSAASAGAVYVFTRNGATWRQQAYIKASDTDVDSNFGYNVALSADGSTLAVGAPGVASAAGAVYVFTRSGTTWSQQAYLKASNTDANDQFGWKVALSGEGSTLAVAAYLEDSAATGIGGNQANNSATDSGAVYVFTRSGTTWVQQSYLKASNTGVNDQFGWSIALSAEGSILAVGAMFEGSAAVGIGGNQTDNSAGGAGAVYVFTLSNMTWRQQAYVKASNTGADDRFGWSVALSADGSTLAVGAPGEDSAEIDIGGDQNDNSAKSSGAVYVFTQSGTIWGQQAYVKASNTGAGDLFGISVAFSADGSALAVSAPWEDSAATYIGGPQDNNSARDAGAVYAFTRSGTMWSQQAYVKASNTGADDLFGFSVAFSADGSTLAVGAPWEGSPATGIGGPQDDNSAEYAGAVYVFRSRAWLP